MLESGLRFRLVIARAADSTPADVSGIVTRLHTDTELFWLLSIARPIAAAPKVCRRSVATCLALLMLDDHLRVLRVLPMASVPHTPGTGVLRRDGVIQTYLGGLLPPRALADTKRIAELLINGHSSYLDTLCQALSGDTTPDGFEAVPADHELYDPEAKRYFAPPLTVWYRADVLVHPVVPEPENPAANQSPERIRPMSVINPDLSGRRARRRNILLWVAQGVVAALFLFTGVIKLTMPIAILAQVSKLPGAFMRFIAVAELVGALGLVLPGLLRIKPGLTPLAAACLLIIMIGATFLTAANQGIAAATLPFVVGGLLVVIMRGRREWASISA